jgi:hypothetical protein
MFGRAGGAELPVPQPAMLKAMAQPAAMSAEVFQCIHVSVIILEIQSSTQAW